MSLLAAIGASIGGARAALPDGTASATSLLPDGCTAGVQLKSTGRYATRAGFGVTTWVEAGDWVMPVSAAGAAFEVRTTVTSGAVDGSATGAWLALSADRSWSVTNGGTPGTVSATMTIEIRRAASGAVVDSAAWTLQATAESA